MLEQVTMSSNGMRMNDLLIDEREWRHRCKQAGVRLRGNNEGDWRRCTMKDKASKFQVFQSIKLCDDVV